MSPSNEFVDNDGSEKKLVAEVWCEGIRLNDSSDMFSLFLSGDWNLREMFVSSKLEDNILYAMRLIFSARYCATKESLFASRFSHIVAPYTVHMSAAGFYY